MSFVWHAKLRRDVYCSIIQSSLDSTRAQCKVLPQTSLMSHQHPSVDPGGGEALMLGVSATSRLRFTQHPWRRCGARIGGRTSSFGTISDSAAQEKPCADCFT